MKPMPCPFCRSERVSLDRFGHTEANPRYAVCCEAEGCMANGPEADTREHAVARWNAVAALVHTP